MRKQITLVENRKMQRRQEWNEQENVKQFREIYYLYATYTYKGRKFRNNLIFYTVDEASEELKRVQKAIPSFTEKWFHLSFFMLFNTLAISPSPYSADHSYQGSDARRATSKHIHSPSLQKQYKISLWLKF